MNPKKITTIMLLLFVAASLVMLGYKGIRGNNSTTTAGSLSSALVEQTEPADSGDIDDTLLKPDADVDVVYYFMTKQRCPSCLKIDAYAREAVKEQYGDRLADNSMMWKMVEVDQPQNSHFIKDYELFTKSVVVVRYRNGKQVKWKNLDQVWNLLGDKAEFQDYIVREINAFIGES